MNGLNTRVAELLIDVECELRNLNLWQEERPTEEALASTQPFCVDTLEFHQWLQFIFVEKLRTILAQNTALPPNCGIAPMAEEYYRGTQLNVEALIQVLKTLDEVITKG